MSDLPAANNVYGYLRSKVGLQDVANTLRYSLGLTEEQVFVRVSQFDSRQTLRIRLEHCEFDTQSLEEGDRWLLNGAVAGDSQTIRSTLEEICKPLQRKGYQVSLEVYDDDFEFLFDYP